MGLLLQRGRSAQDRVRHWPAAIQPPSSRMELHRRSPDHGLCRHHRLHRHASGHGEIHLQTSGTCPRLPWLDHRLLYQCLLYLDGSASGIISCDDLCRKRCWGPVGWPYWNRGYCDGIVLPGGSVFCAALFRYPPICNWTGLDPGKNRFSSPTWYPTNKLGKIGFLMLRQIGAINWNYAGDAIPSFVTIIFIPFSYSVAYGLIA